MIKKRISWQKVRQMYPHQWVGFRDPEYNDDNTLKTVLLVYTGKNMHEITHLQILEDGLYGLYTTPDDSADTLNVGVAY